MAIQLFVPTFRVEECLDEIRICLEKGWPGMGFKTIEFEEEWKKYSGLPYAHYLNSATAGLELAFEVLKLKNCWADDDEVITTPLTFVSSNHAILLSKLKAVFADVNDTFCLDPKSVEERITPKTRAVLYVGLGGNVGDYNRIVELCKKYKLALILDAAHMSGTRVDGVIPGKEADAVIYSFQAVKNLPTADSGMICFKNGEYDTTVRKLSWLGINKDTYSRTNSSGNYKWKYDVEYVGHKDHGNSIMAAIGLVQLRYLDRDNAYRRQLAAWYDEAFKFSDKISHARIPENCESSRHLYQILVDDRDGLMQALNAKDIFPGVHYIDNTQYRMYSYAGGSCPYAHYVSDHVLSLPMHLRLTKDDVDLVAGTVVDYVR